MGLRPSSLVCVRLMAGRACARSGVRWGAGYPLLFPRRVTLHAPAAWLWLRSVLLQTQRYFSGPCIQRRRWDARLPNYHQA